MRRMAIVLVAGLSMASCGGANTEPGNDTVPFERWCAEQTVDRCVDGFFFLYWEPEQEQCVIEAGPDEPLDLRCLVEPATDDVPPETTIPSPESIAEDERRAAEYEIEAESRRARLRSDRPHWEPKLVGLLQATHPADQVTMTVVPIAPLLLDAADALVARLGGSFELAWRTDYACLPGAGVMDPQPSRSAYRDGVERAAKQRRHAESGKVTVTGRFIVEDIWARMEQAARALEEPGVRIEALTAKVPVSSIPTALADPMLRHVWLASTGEQLLTLTETPRPDCSR